jgi:hypothetical protein
MSTFRGGRGGTYKPLTVWNLPLTLIVNRLENFLLGPFRVFRKCSCVPFVGRTYRASSGGRAGGPGSGTSSRRLLRRSFSLFAAGEFLLMAALAAAFFHRANRSVSSPLDNMQMARYRYTSLLPSGGFPVYTEQQWLKLVLLGPERMNRWQER